MTTAGGVKTEMAFFFLRHPEGWGRGKIRDSLVGGIEGRDLGSWTSRTPALGSCVCWGCSLTLSVRGLSTGSRHRSAGMPDKGRLRNGKILRVTGVRELEDAGSVPHEWGVPLGLSPDFASYCLCNFRPVTWPL